VSRTALVLALVALAALPAQGQEPAPWDEKFYNPKPAEGDLTLPLPCGARMTFRAVATPAEDTPLADRAVRLGGTDDDTGYADYIRREHILGSLIGPEGARLFYLGKYEVTQDQYAAVMAETCPEPKMSGRLPAAALSWFDAVAFGRRASEWLLTNQRDTLPQILGVAAYLRLPTEVEWEYAVRGGAAVSEAQFRERIFPIEGPLSDYAWYQGPESAGGRLNLTGLLLPNPLDLHDMLGNVEELVLEPFYMNRIGRRHGQPGGIVAKGGSFQDPADRLRSAMRREYSEFDQRTGLAMALDSFGFRMALAAPVELSLDEATRLRDEWLAARGRRVETGDDPLEAVRALADETTDFELMARLEAVEELFGAELSKRNVIEDRAVRAALLNGALLMRTLKEDNKLIGAVEAARGIAESRGQSELLERYDAQLANWRQRIELSTRAYTSTLFQIAEDYPPARRRAQHDVLVADLQSSGQEGLARYVTRFTEELSRYTLDPSLETGQLIERAIAD
jgi:hypothetical protein